jgi:hypothetical protein
MSDNKYKIFRNFMVNELGIGREDIKEWTMQAVRETVEKELRGLDLNDKVRDVAMRIIRDNATSYNCQRDAVVNAVSAILRETVEISFKPKGGEG